VYDFGTVGVAMLLFLSLHCSFHGNKYKRMYHLLAKISFQQLRKVLALMLPIVLVLDGYYRRERIKKLFNVVKL
jgi:hypothetical protein